MADRWLERKFAELATIPLFGKPPSKSTTKHKPPKNVGRSECPACGKTVGLYVMAVRHDFHRVIGYRRHWRRRYSGDAFICPRSNTEHNETEGGSL